MYLRVKSKRHTCSWATIHVSLSNMACVVGNLSALNKKNFCFYVHFIHYVHFPFIDGRWKG